MGRDMQALFDASYRKVYTRDRKGGKVPDGLRVEKGFRIQSAENWVEYKRSEERIRKDIRELARKTGKGSVCSEGHEVQLFWEKNTDACHSKNHRGKRNRYGTRFYCNQCDAKYCGWCVTKPAMKINSTVQDLKTDGILHKLDSETNSVWLFHGTTTEAATAITQGDFL